MQEQALRRAHFGSGLNICQVVKPVKERFDGLPMNGDQADMIYKGRMSGCCKLPDPADPTTTAASLSEDWPWWNVPEAEQVRREMEVDPRWEAWVSATRG